MASHVRVAPGVYEIVKNKKYKIRYEGSPDPLTGQRRQVSETLHCTKAQASKYRMRKQIEAEDGEQFGQLTLNQLTEKWEDAFRVKIKMQKRKQKTLESYRDQLDKHILPVLGECIVEKLLPINVLDFLHAKTDDPALSLRTVDYLYNILRSICNFGLNARLIKHNPANLKYLWDPPEPKKKHVNIWSPEQVQNFFTKIQGHRFYVSYLLGLLAGLRPGEAAGLKWCCVDFKHTCIRVEKAVQRLKSGIHADTPKSHKSRVVAIGPFLIKVLKQERRRQKEARLELGGAYTDHGWVICRPDGKQWDPKLAYKDLLGLVKAHEMPRVTPHDLRHMYTSHRRENGDDMYDISRALGHGAGASAVTDRYNHPGFRQDKEAAVRLEQRLFQQPQETKQCELL